MINVHQPETRKADNDMFTSTLTFSCKKLSFHPAFSKSECSPASTQGQTISPCYEERESSQTQEDDSISQSNSTISRGFRKASDYCETTREENNNCEIIERVLKSQNYNLQQQNRLLLNEIYKLKKQNKKNNQIYNAQKYELMRMKEQCQVQKRRAAYMKGIILDKLMVMEDKLTTTDTVNTSQSESLLEGLNASENGRYSYNNN